jgi:hypothetical protein
MGNTEHSSVGSIYFLAVVVIHCLTPRLAMAKMS